MEKLRNRSIQWNILVGMIGISVLLVFITSIVSYRFTYDSVEENSIDYTSKLIEQVNSNIEYYLEEMDSISRTISFNYDIKDYFTKSDLLTDGQKVMYEDRIKASISTILESREDIVSICVFGYSGNIITSKNRALNSNANIEEQDWYINALSNNGKVSISSSHVQNIFKGEYPWVVSLSRELENADNQKPIGVLLIDLNYNVINEICSNIELGEKGYIYIIDQEGDIVWHPYQRLIHSGLQDEVIDDVLMTKNGSFSRYINGEDQIYTVKSSERTGWKIVGVTYSDELVSNSSDLQLYFGITILVILVLALVISYFISRSISKPIKRLKKSMEKVQAGNLHEIVDIKTNNEIGDLSHTFNQMTEEIRLLLDKNVAEQRLKRKSELKALQAQINPHFLYNTLDSIMWMSLANKNEEVVEMTAALAKLFRLSINKGAEFITVEDELKHVENYLIIQKYRYDSKLNYKITCDDTIYRYKMLKLSLQPLVENSIYHGIKNKDGDGNIIIRAKDDGDYILLEVEDDGVGMTKEQLTNIYTKDSQKGSGVGVKNVNERLKLYFGEAFGLHYQSTIYEGTTVRIRIPKMEMNADEK